MIDATGSSSNPYTANSDASKTNNSSFSNRIDQRLHQQKLKNTKNIQNKQLQDLQRQHVSDIDIEKSMQALKLKSERDNFFLQFNSLKKNHQKIFNNLNKKFSTEINDLKKEFLKSKSHINGIKEDSFYHQKKIRTAVKDLGKYYEITVDVPRDVSHHLNLTTNKRELKINFNRKFENIFSDIDNSVNSSYSGESITKKISLPDILSSENMITNVYDTKTVFKVNKA